MGNTTSGSGSGSGSGSASTLHPFIIGEFIPPTDSTHIYPYNSITSSRSGIEIIVFIHPENVLFSYYKLIYDTLHKFDASIHEPTRDHLVVVDTTKPIMIRLGIISNRDYKYLFLYRDTLVHSLLLPSNISANWFTIHNTEPNTLICIPCNMISPFKKLEFSIYYKLNDHLDNFIKNTLSIPIVTFTENPFVDETIHKEILSKKHPEYSIDYWAFGKTPEQEKAHMWLMFKREMMRTHHAKILMIIRRYHDKSLKPENKKTTQHTPIQIPTKFNKEVDKYCGVPPKPKKSRKEKYVSSKDVKLEVEIEGDDEVEGDDEDEVKDETSSFLRYRKLTSEDDRWNDDDAETKPLID
jgi:hypothetical protein